jgi:hypothetical protein
MIPRPMITTREAATGDVTKGHGGFTSDTQAFDAGRGRGLVVFFSRCAKMASVSAIFVCGLAVSTLRNRKPIRLRTSAMVLGEGHGSALSPWPSTVVGQRGTKRRGVLRMGVGKLAEDCRDLGTPVCPTLAAAAGRLGAQTKDACASLGPPEGTGMPSPPTDRFRL